MPPAAFFSSNASSMPSFMFVPSAWFVPLSAEWWPITSGASLAATQTGCSSRSAQTWPSPQSPSTLHVCGEKSVEHPVSASASAPASAIRSCPMLASMKTCLRTPQGSLWPTRRVCGTQQSRRLRDLDRSRL